MLWEFKTPLKYPQEKAFALTTCQAHSLRRENERVALEKAVNNESRIGWE